MSIDTGKGIDVKLSLEAVIGRLGETIDKMHKFLTPNPIVTPILRPILGSATAAAAALTYTFMDLGGPPNGWRREVRWFAVWPPDPFTTLAGVTVIAFIAGAGQYQDSSTEPAGFTQLVEGPASVWNRFSANSGEVTLLPGQHLFLCFKSLANNQQVNAFGQAWDVCESAVIAGLP